MPPPPAPAIQDSAGGSGLNLVHKTLWVGGIIAFKVRMADKMKFLLIDCWLHGGKVLDAEVEEREEQHWVGCLGHSMAVDTRALPMYETRDPIAKTEGLNEEEKERLLGRSKMAA